MSFTMKRSALVIFTLLPLATACRAANSDIHPRDAITQPVAGTHGPLPREIPFHFQSLLDYDPTGAVYYIAQNAPGASNDNDGLSPDYEGEGQGPWLDFAAAKQHGVTLNPGDALVIRGGVYSIGGQTISLSMSGAEGAPIKIMAYPGEAAVIQGGFDPGDWQDALNDLESAEAQELASYKDMPLVRIGGDYLIVQGLTLRGCYVVCVLLKGDHNILAENTIEGSLEDGVKTTQPSQDNLILGNEFFAFGDQAIDIWGARHTFIISNEFHHSDESLPWGVGNPLWTKGDSHFIYLFDNYFHDLTVKSHALNLGGCCWNNWLTPIEDENGELRPVATHIFAYNNTFERIAIAAGTPAPYPGVIGVEGCRDCLISDNLILDSGDAFGIHATVTETQRVTAQNIAVQNNTVARSKSGRLYNLVYDAGVFLGENTYYLDEAATVRIGRNEMSFADFQAAGYDVNSRLHPAGE